MTNTVTIICIIAIGAMIAFAGGLWAGFVYDRFGHGRAGTAVFFAPLFAIPIVIAVIMDISQ